MALDRRSRSPLARWWMTIDKPLFVSLLSLMALGFLLVMAGSPPVAERLNASPNHFIIRQAGFLLSGLGVMIAISFCSLQQLKLGAIVGMLGSLFLLALVLVFGAEVKGARRWLDIGFSLQPSEFAKPLFAVTTAWLFAKQYEHRDFRSRTLSTGLFAVTILLLILQPDMGMTFTICIIWMGQFFLAGLPLAWLAFLILSGIGGFILAYMAFPHVSSRIHAYLDPEAGGNYQLNRALEAFENGGWFGVGSGQGVVKRVLPDAHTDFIFSVGVEEHGLLMGIAILLLISFILFRGWQRALKTEDLFSMLAISGLMIQFAAQSMINIGVNLGLLPTKGMTLPLISYGGSSTLGVALGMGVVLALTRKRYGVKGLERMRHQHQDHSYALEA